MSDAQGEDLLEAYDARLRGRIPDPLPKDVSVERDGPLVRFVGLDERGFVDYRDLDGIEGAELDELIARQVRFFGERGLRFEWKHRSHDRPADLTDRLLAAGFVPEDVETVLIARVADITGEVSLADGATLREVTQLRDLRRLEAMEHAIWGGERHRMAERLDSERTADPDGITILIVEAGGEVVCGCWVRFEPAAGFATLWGGATLPGWRGRGIYRAAVAYRANLAATRGLQFVQVDASDESRPILERLGFTVVTRTTPYIWSPQRPTA
jgi:GNAT superfamily N-acetyltransferase